MRRTTSTIVVLLTLCCHVGLAQEALENIMSDYRITGCRYWFDNASSVTQAKFQSGQLTLNVAALAEGFHTLHYQVVDDRGGVSPTQTKPLFRVSSEDEQFKDYTISIVRYWFDKDYTPREVAYVSGTSAIDVSALEEGFHTLHYQVIDSKGETSPSRTAPFFRVASADEQFKDYIISKVRYWFDKDYTPREVAYVSGTSAIDVSLLEEGFHTLHYQVIDSKGETSPSRTAPFFRVASVGEQFKDYTISKVRYWFDKDYTPREVAYAGGTSAIDVSALEEGFHTLHYQVIDSKGESSPSRTAPFFRVASAGEQFKDYTISKVRYWFDDDVATARIENYNEQTGVLNFSYIGEGVHTLHYQVITDEGQVSPTRSVDIDRWLYDIYISRNMVYGGSLIAADPIFATKPDLKLHYLPTDLAVRGHLTVAEDAELSLGKFVQTTNLGAQTSNRFTKTGTDYYHPTTLVNKGFLRADSVQVKMSLYRDRWHFISLPFNVNVKDIGVSDDTYWALRLYDGEARAAGMMAETWKNLKSDGIMEARHGYILQLTKESQDKTSQFAFKALNDSHKNDIFTTQDVTMPLEEHQAEFAHNRSWNLVGNPYPSFFDTRFIGQSGNIIVWNGNGYSAYSLLDDDYVLMPFEAFFIQRPVNADNLTFSSEGRQGTHEVRTLAAARGTVRGDKQDGRQIVNFTLSDGTDTDASRIVINELAAKNYESDRDAPKFMEARPQSPQLFSIEGGVRYAINERPMDDGVVTFSIYAPTEGEYRFSLDGDAGDAVVLDTENGAVWPLSDGDYTFEAQAGTNDARLMVSLKGDVTGIIQVCVFDDGEIKAVAGQLTFSFARAKNVKVFSMDGRMLYSDTKATGSISLRGGIYVLSIDGTSTKVIIK